MELKYFLLLTNGLFLYIYIFVFPNLQKIILRILVMAADLFPSLVREEFNRLIE